MSKILFSFVFGAIVSIPIFALTILLWVVMMTIEQGEQKRMKRLTKQGAVTQKDIDELLELSNENQFGRNEAYYRLQHYEDLIEKGKLIELPCSVGDTVYLISYQYSECSKYNERFDDYCCQGCEDECNSHKEYFIHINYDVSLEWIARAMRNNCFGKTVFLTKEEALARLAELRGEQEWK